MTTSYGTSSRESMPSADELFARRPIVGADPATSIAQDIADQEAARLLVAALSEPAEAVTIGADSETEPSKIQWPSPMGAAAYHGLAGDIVRKIEPHTESDPAAILIQLLTVFGNVAGRYSFFRVEASRHYPNLNAVIVGNTSKGRKGTSLNQVLRLFDAIDEGWRKDCTANGLSSGEGLIWAVRDEIRKTEPLKEKGKVTGYQEIVADLGVEDKRLLVIEQEFASVLKVASRDGNTLSPIIREAWDSGRLRTLTKNSPARATDAHVSIIGHITRDELRRYMESTEAANGFANRFLWVCVRRSKELPEGGRLDLVNFDAEYKALKKAQSCAGAERERRRDAQARDYWHSIYSELSGDRSGMLGAITGRAEAQVMRLALIYALLDCADDIRLPHLTAAHEVWRYAEDSARFIFGDAVGDPVADSILSALKEAGAGGLTRTQISDLLGRNKTAATIGRALETLAEAGRVRCWKEAVETGRPVERWAILSPNIPNLPDERNERNEKRGNGGRVISLNSFLSSPDTGEEGAI